MILIGGGMKTPAWLSIGLLPTCALAAAAASAVDVPIPLRVYLNKPGVSTKFLSRGTVALPDPDTDSPVNEGGQITFTQGASSETIPLPSANWAALGKPPGAKGFKYADPSGATCKKVRVTGTSIKGICKPTAPGAPPFDAASDPAISMVLSIGSATQRYCGECPNGGEQKGNPLRRTKMKDCLAPAACPSSAPVAVCCDFAEGCSSAPSAIACLELTGGTAVGGGAVCDASGNCVASPGVPGECCEGAIIVPVCSMVVDQTACENNGGSYHGSAICQPSAVCIPTCPADASACNAYGVPASPCRTCCDAVSGCAACAAAEAASCANAGANTSCAGAINADGCAYACCP